MEAGELGRRSQSDRYPRADPWGAIVSARPALMRILPARLQWGGGWAGGSGLCRKDRRHDPRAEDLWPGMAYAVWSLGPDGSIGTLRGL